MEQINPNYADFNLPIDKQQLNNKECERIPVECPNCFQQGESITCIVKIPHFQDQIIMSFNCEFCEYKSNEIKGANGYKEFGQKITLQVKTELDLKRELYKSDCCSVLLPNLDLELDYGTLGSMYTTVEGLIKQILDNLEEHNPFTHDAEDSLDSQKMNKLFGGLQDCINLKNNFTLILEDPAGESHISSILNENKEDLSLKIENFTRTEDQNDWLGITDIKTE